MRWVRGTESPEEEQVVLELKGAGPSRPGIVHGSQGSVPPPPLELLEPPRGALPQTGSGDAWRLIHCLFHNA